ncbi:MAG: hypothetical protein KC502_11355 [Myxococcales bacterium]|nr:hypothetical protein [Myxococcales bacterium]
MSRTCEPIELMCAKSDSESLNWRSHRHHQPAPTPIGSAWVSRLLLTGTLLLTLTACGAEDSPVAGPSVEVDVKGGGEVISGDAETQDAANVDTVAQGDTKSATDTTTGDATGSETDGGCEKQGPESCNGVDDDCDGETDEGTCDDDEACTADVCKDGKCSNPGTAAPCDADNDACTEDKCTDSGCAPGKKKVCDDDNPCTNDTCDSNSGACGHGAVADGQACDDGNACTTGDACAKGTCAGNASSCDDKNPCTTDTCDKAAGCVHKASSGACSDDDKCTSGDACDAAGKCIAGATKDCNDDNPCTTDSCESLSGTCVNAAVAAGTCNDGNACTTGEKCEAGKCAGKALTCDDNNPCTSDTCDSKAGCSYAPIGAPCNDGDACTEFDICAKGVCAGKPKSASLCDDSNPCTTDSCSAKSGCINLPTAATCTDGDSCTTNGCKAGKCETTSYTCGCADDAACASKDDDNLCNGKLFCDKTGKIGVCKVAPSSVVECDTSSDGTCLKTACEPKTGKCIGTKEADGKACDADGSICTEGDACKGGACTTGAKANCDDKNPCTTDSCDKAAGCAHIANQASCDADGNACTVGDGCKDKLCLKGAKKPCDDSNACTTDSCDPKTGNCIFKKESGTKCDADGSFCTTNDNCKDGVCTKGAALPCDDKNPCTNDACNATAGCVHVANTKPCDADGNPCTVDDTCSGKACVAGSKKSCDDGQKCTADSCDPKTGACKHEVIVGCGGFCKTDAHCDDSNTCTSDKCTDSKCVWTPVSSGCDDGNACTVKDSCIKGLCSGLKKPCGDGNPCTNDGCLPSSGCVHLNNAGPCDDFDGCTLSDTCKAGKCAPGTKKQCIDGDKCTTDACNPADGGCIFKGIPGCGGYCAVATDCDDKNACTDDKCDKGKCVSTVNTKSCDDGSQCTTGDQCADGKCKPGKAKVCDDKDPCTIDGCDPKNAACTVKPGKEGLACDDGAACTKDDKCAKTSTGLSCKGTAKTCNDGNACTKDSCDAKTGGCVNVAASGPCSDGDPCTAGDVCAAGKCVTSTGVFVGTLAGSTAGFADGKAAKFNKPYGVAVDGETVYVADSANHRIRKVTKDGTTTTFAGSGKNGLFNAQGTKAWFNAPYGVDVGAGGVVYVADRNNHVIRKITKDGTTTTLAGSGTAGATNGPHAKARFRFPYGVAAAGDGSTVYVADTYNHRIRKITKLGVSTFAGSSYGFADGAGTKARFRYPIDVAVDRHGAVYVADQSNHRIRKITPGGQVSTFAGSGTAGFLDGGLKSARFYNPWGVAVDAAGVVYVGDRYNQKIRRIEGGVVTRWAGTSAGFIDGKALSSKLYYPSAVAVSAQGVVYVGDGHNNRIRAIRDARKPCALDGACWANGAISPKSPCQQCNADISKTKWTTSKDGTACADAALCTTNESCKSGQCSGTTTSCDDKDNCTTDSCDKGTGGCAHVPIIGCGGNCSADKDCNDKNPCTTDACTQGKCAFTANTQPCDDGNPCSWGDKCAQGKCVSGDRTEVSTFAGSTAGYLDGKGKTAKLYYPRGITAHPAGGVIVADGHNHRIRRVDANGVVTTVAGSTAGYINAKGAAAKFYYPSDVAVNAKGVIYVADLSNQRIRKIDSAGNVTLLAGSGAGFKDGKGASARFYHPHGVAVTAGDIVYVADSYNNRIRRITPDGVVVTLAGSTKGYANGKGAAAKFNYPIDVTVAADGSVVVADYNNNRIRRITPDGVASLIAGSGTAGYLDGAPGAARFNRPWGVTTTPDGRIYVADRYNYRLRKIAANGLVSRLAGTGSGSFSDGDAITTARFREPWGITVAKNGDVLTGDYYNHRIRRIRQSAGACNISGVCTTAGTTKPGAACQACDAAQSAKAWSQLSDGSICADGKYCTLTDKCASGSCVGKVKSCDDGNKCSADSCDAATGACAHKAVPKCDSWCFTNADCEDGNPCVTDTCVDASAGKPGSCKHVANSDSCEDGNTCTAGDKCKDGKCIAGGATWVSTLAGSAAGYVNGDSKTARFNQPHGIDVTPAGVVWVADTYNHRIRQISGGKVTMVAGGKIGYANGSPTVAKFNYPSDVAFSDKVTFVADRGNHRIRTVDSNGNVGLLAGSSAGFTDGKGASARFYNPFGIDATPGGIVYVGDYSNHRLRRVTPDGTVTTVTGGAAGHVDGPKGTARLYTPIDVTILPNGNLVVVEYAGHRLRLVTPNGTASLLAGAGKLGYVNDKGALARFNYPRGIDMSPGGYLVVADQNNQRIRKVLMDGTVSDFAGSSAGYLDGDASDARFSSPRDVAVGVDGAVYVGDVSNHRVREIRDTTAPCKIGGRCWVAGARDPASACKACVATKSATSFTALADGSACTDGALCTEPDSCKGGACKGPAKSCDDKKVCTKDACSATTGACTHTPIVGCDGYCTKDSQCDDDNPCTLGASCKNNKCQQGDTTFVDTLAGAGKGYADGPAKNAKFNNPRGLAVDGKGRVVVGDMSNHRIRLVQQDGTTTTIAGSGKAGLVDGQGTQAWFNGPSGVAVDNKGTIWIADRYTHAIRKLDTTGKVTTIAGKGIAGYNDDLGAAARFNQPTDLAVTPKGMLYVADAYNHKIRRVESDGTVHTLSGLGAGFVDGDSAKAKFRYPIGVALGADGMLFVADYGNHRIRRVTPDGEVITVAGSGVAGSLDGASANAQFIYPWGISVDKGGRIFVVERSAHRLRMIAGGIVQKAAGYSYGYVDGGASVARFYYPSALARAPNGELFIGDETNGRVRRVRLTANACQIGGVCYADGVRSSTAPCMACIGKKAAKSWTAVADGAVCDDGSPCSLKDTCKTGKCGAGTSKTCNDSNKCTVDSCDADTGACTFKPNFDPNCKP